MILQPGNYTLAPGVYGLTVPAPLPPPPPATGKLQFFGGVSELPSTSFAPFVKAPYTAVTQYSKDALYQLVTITSNVFNWGNLDNVVNFCRANNAKFTWYCGYQAWAEGQNFPANYGYTGANLVTWFNNAMQLAAARYTDLQNFCYFNYCNEGLLHGNSSGNWASAFGGAGGTGVDWIINTGKVVRKFFPVAKIGINDFNFEDSASMHGYGGGASQLPQALNALPHIQAAGVLDWMGMEGYNLDSQTSAGLTSALNQVGAIAPVIYTEFSPGSYDCFWVLGTASDPPQSDTGTWPPQQSNQIAAWKRLLPLLAGNPNCIGITGPWWRNKSSSHCGWIVDDTVNPVALTPAMQWLQTYIPTVT